MKKNWTHADDDKLREMYPHTLTRDICTILGASERAIYARANLLGLKKTAAYLATVTAGRLGHGKGKDCQFQKGQTPWNKGRAFDSGGRSHETRFKPGQKPHTWNPVGHERLTKEGYRERKVSDTGITRQDYVGLHILAWREVHGDVPKGHAVVFRDGNKENVTIANLECITRAELMRRNSYHNNYPKDVQLLIQLRGAVNRQINKHKEIRK